MEVRQCVNMMEMTVWTSGKCTGFGVRCLNFGSLIGSCVTLGKLLNHSELQVPYQENGEKHLSAKVARMFSWGHIAENLGHNIPPSLPPFLPLFPWSNIYWAHTTCYQCSVLIPLDPFTIFVHLTLTVFLLPEARICVCLPKVCPRALPENQKGLRTYIPLWAFLNQEQTGRKE